MTNTNEQSTLMESCAAATSVVVIGAGAGGVSALSEMVPIIPATFPACIVVVQRMRPGFTNLLANELNRSSETEVVEAVNGQPLKAGTVLIVPGGMTAQIIKHECSTVSIELQDVDEPEQSRIRMDTTMSSAAQVFGAQAVGVVITGMGHDGRNGLKAIREKGGRTLAQDEASSIVFDMPKAAIDAGVVDEVVPLWSIVDRLIDLIGDVHGSFLQEAAG